MENILPQRLKNITIFPLLVIPAGVLVLYWILFFPSPASNQSIDKQAQNHIRAVEQKLEQLVSNYKERSDQVFQEFRSRTPRHSRLMPKEALIIEENGVIKNYFGEIYHYKFPPLEKGAWAFIEKNQDLYFLREMADQVFYVRYLFDLDDNPLLQPLFPGITFAEMRYSPTPLLALENKYIYDDINKMFFYYHLLGHSNGQFILHLKFSKNDIESYLQGKKRIFFSLVFGLLLVVGTAYFKKKKPMVSRLLWMVFLGGLFVFISQWGESNLYLKLNLPGMILKFHSLYQVLVILLFLFSLLYFLRTRFRYWLVSFLFFNGALVLLVIAGRRLFKAVQFNFTDSNWNYLMLIMVVFLFHLFPLLFFKGMADEFPKKLKKPGEKIIGAVIFLLVQAAFIFALHSGYAVPVGNIVILSIIAFIWLLAGRGFLSQTVIIFLAAISMYHLISGYSLAEKKDFIENSLKNILLNQSNYAKFIAREIVQEINSTSSDLDDFFQGNTSAKLETIWHRTLAFRENIASGIFVLSKADEVLSYFAYQIPFFKVKTRNIFPFWAIEDTVVDVHGREIPLAAAYISVFKEWDDLGRIMVLVSNSPELLLRYQDKVNIFTLNKKIDGRDFSYIKLNADNQIVENPSNINLENITGILKHNGQWIRFEAMDMVLTGYIFRHSGNTIMIFFPGNTLFKNLSEVIKIFLMLSLLVLLLYARELRKIDWRSLYYSFSIRVFGILILISLLTAVIFSLFFFNFSAQSSKQKIMRMVYENGRTAQNIAYNLVDENSEITQEQLFSMSDMLNGDVSVYEKSGLAETSNYRKIIDSQIPLYLHSQILASLNEKKQKFVLLEDEKNFRLFFKIYDYIFMVEFSNKWEKTVSEERYYTDFIITLFFILIVIGFAAAFFSRNKILSPIDGLNRGMAEVEKGNLPRLEKIPAEIEIKRLYMGFNAMIEGIREQKRTISEISRMKTIIRLGRQVAHEVKNPLTPIQLSAEQILEALKDKNPNYEEIIKQSVDYIIDETHHLKKVSYGFLDLSRLDEVNAEEFDLTQIISEELFNVRQLYAHIHFSFSTGEADGDVDQPGPLKVTLDKIKMKQVLKNLIINSIEAIGEKKGEIRILLKKKEEDRRVIIEVLDNGIGMDEKQFERLFEMDYSTKEIGTGLGLFIVKRIIELHKGHIDIRSGKNQGTRVIVDLPQRVSGE